MSVGHEGEHDIASLVETYLVAESQLVAAVELAGGAVPLPDGRAVTVGRAEFDALLSQRRKRAWVVIRRRQCRRGVISVFGLDDCPLDLRLYWQSPGVAGKGSTCRSPEAVTNS
jgi:hypothetical protein